MDNVQWKKSSKFKQKYKTMFFYLFDEFLPVGKWIRYVTYWYYSGSDMAENKHIYYLELKKRSYTGTEYFQWLNQFGSETKLSRQMEDVLVLQLGQSKMHQKPTSLLVAMLAKSQYLPPPLLFWASLVI
jgi:hypothetical protein